jgi:hypothetical protein
VSNAIKHSGRPQSARLVYGNCGQAFAVFLEEMTEHNSKVVCPNWGSSVSAEQGTPSDLPQTQEK